ALRTAHIAHADGAAEEVAIVARGDAAPDLAVAPYRFIVIEQRRRITQLELQQPPAQPLLALAQYGVAADEVAEGRARLLRLHRKAQSGLQHMIFIGDVMAEVAEGLLDAAGVEGVQAAEPQAMAFTG